MFQSVQFSHSVMSDSLWPHESQHARPPCPSPTPGVHSDSHPSSQWCHPAISSSVVPFSSCPQSIPASESFPMSQFFAWGGQSTGVSASASFLQRNPRADLLQNGLVGSPCSPRDSQCLVAFKIYFVLMLKGELENPSWQWSKGTREHILGLSDTSEEGVTDCLDERTHYVWGGHINEGFEAKVRFLYFNLKELWE